MSLKEKIDCRKVRLYDRLSLIQELESIGKTVEWYKKVDIKRIESVHLEYTKLRKDQKILFLSHKWNGSNPDNKSCDFYVELLEIIKGSSYKLIFLDFISIEDVCVSPFLNNIEILLASSSVKVAKFNEELYHQSVFCQVELIALFGNNIRMIEKFLLPKIITGELNRNSYSDNFDQVLQLCKNCGDDEINVLNFNKMCIKVLNQHKFEDSPISPDKTSIAIQGMLDLIGSDLYNNSAVYYCRKSDEYALLSTLTRLQILIRKLINEVIYPQFERGNYLIDGKRNLTNFCNLLKIVKNSLCRIAEIKSSNKIDPTS